MTFPVLPNQTPASRYPLHGLYHPCTTSRRKRKSQLREPHVVSRTPHSGHRGSYKEAINALSFYLTSFEFKSRYKNRSSVFFFQINTRLVLILGHDHFPVLCNLLLTNYFNILPYVAGTRGEGGRSWLKHRATSRKVAGWIPDYVIGIFH
jgi:hypothetical protein